ncbi:MAG: hypothetical protein ACTHJ7_11055, partial [Candidatus Nitrosocosmicus sp.]
NYLLMVIQWIFKLQDIAACPVLVTLYEEINLKAWFNDIYSFALYMIITIMQTVNHYQMNFVFIIQLEHTFI